LKAKPAAILFLLAVLYGFFSRLLGDNLQTNMFQAPLVIIPLTIAACLAFNLFYSLRPAQSGLRVAGWLIMLWLGYLLAGLAHNLFLPNLRYDLTGTFLINGLAVALVGFVIGLATPFLFIRKRRTGLSNHI
jgi:hypothetical protein